MINIKVNAKTANQLTVLSDKRKADQELIKTKQAIVADLVNKAFKKECLK